MKKYRDLLVWEKSMSLVTEDNFVPICLCAFALPFLRPFVPLKK